MKNRIMKNKLKSVFEKVSTYIAYFKIKFLNEIQYKVAALAGLTTQFAWGGMYIMLFSAFLKNGSNGTYTISQMSTYIWLQQSFFALFNMWSADKEIIRGCETGQIEMDLIRPVNLYSIWYAKSLGRKVAIATLRAIPILTICSLPFLGEYRMSMPASFTNLIFFIITMILSTALMMGFLMIMYCVIMRNVSSKGIKSIFQLTLDFLAGGVVPIAFMPDIVVNIIKITPFYYMQNIPFNIYNGYISDISDIIKIISIQLIWGVILTAVGKFILNKQLKKIIVQGG